MEKGSSPTFHPKSDTWALGVMLVDLLTASGQEQGVPAQEQLVQTLRASASGLVDSRSNDAIRLLLQQQSLPAVLVDFVCACIEPDIRRRPAARDLCRHALFAEYDKSVSGERQAVNRMEAHRLLTHADAYHIWRASGGNLLALWKRTLNAANSRLPGQSPSHGDSLRSEPPARHIPSAVTHHGFSILTEDVALAENTQMVVTFGVELNEVDLSVDPRTANLVDRVDTSPWLPIGSPLHLDVHLLIAGFVPQQHALGQALSLLYDPSHCAAYLMDDNNAWHVYAKLLILRVLLATQSDELDATATDDLKYIALRFSLPPTVRASTWFRLLNVTAADVFSYFQYDPTAGDEIDRQLGMCGVYVCRWW